MTANELIKRIQKKVMTLSSGDIPIKYNGKDIDWDVQLIGSNKEGFYINITDNEQD